MFGFWLMFLVPVWAVRTPRRLPERQALLAWCAVGVVFALMIGLRFGPAPPNTATDAGTAMVVTAADASTNVTMLDEDPEFYAWLASADAQQIAME